MHKASRMHGDWRLLVKTDDMKQFPQQLSRLFLPPSLCQRKGHNWDLGDEKSGLFHSVSFAFPTTLRVCYCLVLLCFALLEMVFAVYFSPQVQEPPSSASWVLRLLASSSGTDTSYLCERLVFVETLQDSLIGHAASVFNPQGGLHPQFACSVLASWS